MVKHYEITLDNGRKEYVMFNNYFLRLLSRLSIKDKAKTVEETIRQIFELVSKWQQMVNTATSHEVYSDFDKICIDLIPIVCAANNAYKEAHDLPEDANLQTAEKILNHIEIGGIITILNGVSECIMPKGLPEDSKKKEGEESEVLQAGIV